MNKLSLVALALITCCWGARSYGQAYPDRPIRLIVNFPAGGNVDAIARLITRELEVQHHWNFVLDNRAGANGIIGTEIAASAPADGYTMLFSPGTIVSNQVVYPKVSYDVLKDFIPVTNIGWGAGYLMVVNPSVPAATLKELIALAKKKDSRLTFSTSGVGGTPHFTGELFNLRAGTQLTHVPYKGVPQAITAVVGNEVSISFLPPLAIAPLAKEGKVRVLAFTGASRWPGMPQVPTIAEAALPGFEMRTGWQGWFAPAKTPGAIVTKVQVEIHKALQTPRVRETLIAGGYDPIGDAPAEFRRFIESELKRYREITRAANITLQ